MGQLKQAGRLETTVTEAYDHLSLPMQESALKHNNARRFLQNHKGFMPEERVREVIHETGFPTFPRPSSIPKNSELKSRIKELG